MLGGVLRGKLSFLSNDELQRIHEATLEVLENVGIKCFSDKILMTFTDNGAEVDLKSKIVRIPRDMVKEALKKAPKRFVLCGRNPKYDIVIDNGRIYFGMGGTPTPYFLDIDTGEFRRPTTKDFADVTRLGDALPNLSFLMTIAGAFDVPYEMEYLYEYELLFNNTEKPVVYPAPGCLLYTSPSPRDLSTSRMPSSA